MGNDSKDQITLEGQETTSGGQPVQLPTNLRIIGDMHPDDVKVYILQDVYKKIREFSASDTTKELGGILVGDFAEVMDKWHVVISGYIPARYTDASAATLTFTHESWEDIHRQHQEKFADRKLVGWHHTHPGYDIFLSSYDQFIHQNFFNLKWQIAMVVDPKKKKTGFFQWKGEKLEELGGFFLYDREGATIAAVDSVAENKEPVGRPRRFRALDGVLFALILALSGLVVSLSLGRGGSPAAPPAPAATDAGIGALASQYSVLAGKYDQIASDNAKLEKQLAQLSSPAPAPAPAQSSSAAVQPTPAPGTIPLLQYTVARGDTLHTICQKFGINYSKYKNIIKGINNIKNENLIHTGQVLLLPLSLTNNGN